MEQAQAKKTRRKGHKPELTTSIKPSNSYNPNLLKQKLLEKEAQAAQNRAREIEKLQSKLARQDEHAKRVQQRKRALGRLSNEDLNLSWGGEDAGGLLDAVIAASNKSKGLSDVDSGKGSSTNNSRSGSGRSLGALDIGDTPIIISQ